MKERLFKQLIPHSGKTYSDYFKLSITSFDREIDPHSAKKNKSSENLDKNSNQGNQKVY